MIKRKLKDIPRIEFIGKKVEVIDAKNKSLVGIKGKIIDETKNIFTIEKINGETKKLIKKQITIKTTIQGNQYLIDCVVLQGKSEDRLKKKIKTK